LRSARLFSRFPAIPAVPVDAMRGIASNVLLATAGHFEFVEDHRSLALRFVADDSPDPGTDTRWCRALRRDT
jgi:hypothetical protein